MKQWVKTKTNVTNKGVSIPAGTTGFISPQDSTVYVFPQGIISIPKKSRGKRGGKITTVDISPEKALSTIHTFEKHYCYEGEFQFNIKLYGYVIPDKVRNNFDDSQIYQELQFILEDSRATLGENLMEMFDWIKSFRVEGRSDGWLMLKHRDKLTYASLSEIYREFEENFDDEEEDVTDLMEFESKLTDFAMDLEFIKEMIEFEKDEMIYRLGQLDTWDGLLELIEPSEDEIVTECPKCRFTIKVDIKNRMSKIEESESILSTVVEHMYTINDEEGYIYNRVDLENMVKDVIQMLREARGMVE